MGNSVSHFRVCSKALCANFKQESGRCTVKEKKNRKKIRLPVTPPAIPPEIISEILSWLPLKYLLRYQLVCKQWQAIIQDYHFVKSHVRRANPVVRTHSLVDPERQATVDEEHIMSNSCDGLQLRRNNVTRKFQIVNKAMRKFLSLPDPQECSLGIAFSFILDTGNYKLVSIYYDGQEGGHYGCEVLTVGIDESWRPLKAPNLKDLDIYSERNFLVSTGTIVHFVFKTNGGSKVFELLSLDARTESFISIPLPEDAFPDWNRVWAFDWNGQLAFGEIVKEEIHAVALKDCTNCKWGETKIVSLAFMKEYQDVREDVAPLLAQGGNLWFWLKDKKVFSYNIGKGVIEYCKLPAKGDKMTRKIYGCPSSLVSIKGMQPLSQQNT